MTEEPGTTIRMDFADNADFYASPFPSEHRRAAAGGIDLKSFPNPDSIALVDVIRDLVATDSGGFATTAATYFTTSAPLDAASLPDLRASTKPDAPLFLINVDPSSPEHLARHPVKAGFAADGGPFGAPNLLAMLPYQGLPLRPETLYASVVLRSLADADGKPLGVSEPLARILSGKKPDGMTDPAFNDYESALKELEGAGVSKDKIAGLAVFRTGSSADVLGKVYDHALAQPLPAPAAPFVLTDVFDDYCAFVTTINMPTYQSGTPPYANEGGTWMFDDKGDPIVQGTEVAEFMITLPRTAMPAAGFPVVITSRAGLGGDRPMTDHGPHTEPGGAAPPGSGPALMIAKAGFAGSMIDGPHTGMRNVTNGDSQLLIFNVANPPGLRDNIRESAIELGLQSHILENVTIDASACPGLTTPDNDAVKLDVKTMAGLGHSMGATIFPLILADEPAFRATVLSGAGSSYIDNILYKEKPLATKGLAEVLLHYTAAGYELTELDPIMTLLQWGAEPADPPAYARSLLIEPESEHNVLVIQGIVDHYILPPMANATALSFGIDLAGDALDAESADLSSFSTLGSVLDLSGREQIQYPASGNVSTSKGARTGVVAQHPQDNIEDGHEVLFQLDGPKYQAKCFLSTFAKGTPTVYAPAALSDPCP